MRVLVCGGRDYMDKAATWKALDSIHHKHGITLIIHGACMRRGEIELRGADRWAEEWARAREIAYVGVPARWALESRAGGPTRNQRMLDEWRPEAVLALPGRDGTQDMCDRAGRRGLTPWRPYG